MNATLEGVLATVITRGGSMWTENLPAISRRDMKLVSPIEFDPLYGRRHPIKKLIPQSVLTLYRTFRWRQTIKLDRFGPSDSDVLHIHIPKTAGQSVNLALFGSAEPIGHHSYRFFERFYPEVCRRAFKFSVVRHPLARLRSAFHYLKTDDVYPSNVRFRRTHLRDVDTFPDFVGLLDHDSFFQRMKQKVHFRSQVEFLVDRRGRVGVDYLIQFETLADDFAELCRTIGREAVLAHHNRTNVPRATERIDSKLSDIVRRRYRLDYEILGYD